MWKKYSNSFNVVRKRSELDPDEEISITASSPSSSSVTTDALDSNSNCSVGFDDDNNNNDQMSVDGNDDYNNVESIETKNKKSKAVPKKTVPNNVKVKVTGQRKRGRGSTATSTTKKLNRFVNFNPNKNPNLNFQYTCQLKEDHKCQVYFVAFNEHLKPGEPVIFATVGKNRVSIYECEDESIKILQVYEDPNPEERYYCCAWTINPTGKSLLVAAGGPNNKGGIVRIFDPALGSCIMHMIGHGSAINHLCFHPKDRNLLLTGSGDLSLRLWNIQTEACICIFTGDGGHRDQVVHCDFHLSGTMFVSSGVDHAIKVWRIDKPEVKEAISNSYNYKSNSGRIFPTQIQAFPDYTTREIHGNVVDCIKWFGDFFLSKSSVNNQTNKIICWKPGKALDPWDDIKYDTTMFTILTDLSVTDCDYWFIRFCLDFQKKLLAQGNEKGALKIFDLNTKDPSEIQSAVLRHPNCTTTIRAAAFSRDGNILLAVCDDSTIWRYDLQKEN